MSTLLDYKHIFVKEQVRMFHITNLYELFDKNQQKIGEVMEKGNFLNKITGRYVLEFYNADGSLLFIAKKPFGFIKQKFFIYDRSNQLVGNFYKKIISFIPQFFINDRTGNQLGLLKGDFFAWNFQIDDNQKTQCAVINKIFAGALKEMFTTADHYQIMFYNDKSIDKKLLLAAPFIVDMLMKEKNKRNYNFGNSSFKFGGGAGNI